MMGARAAGRSPREGAASGGRAARIVSLGLALAVELLSPLPTLAAEDSVPPPGWTLAFAEEFETLRLWGEAEGGIFEPYYPWGARTNAGTTEIQYYIDPRPGGDDPALADLAPFTLDADGLVVSARPVPPPLRRLTGNRAYVSGMLTTYRRFSFTYGYAEIRARVPKGKGLWPAFWLAPADTSWPPELDVMEFLGGNPREFHATLHTNESGKHSQVSHEIDTPDLSVDFHTYAVRWTANDVTWYFDGNRVASTPTPADMHKPMYILVNLAIGGWAEEPDSATVFPARYHIDRIRVFVPPPRAEAAP